MTTCVRSSISVHFPEFPCLLIFGYCETVVYANPKVAIYADCLEVYGKLTNVYSSLSTIFCILFTPAVIYVYNFLHMHKVVSQSAEMKK